jgi:outer membrane biosynthesis protein TonB
MVSALLHGHSRSEPERARRWPFAVSGVLATGLVASGIGIANAYQDQRDADDGELPVPTVIVDSPDPSTSPSTAPPSSQPTSTPQSPSATTKQPPVQRKPTQQKPTQQQPTQQQKPTQQQRPTQQKPTQQQKPSQQQPTRSTASERSKADPRPTDLGVTSPSAG